MTFSMSDAGALTPQEELGKLLFFDTNLSEPTGQSCAVCHGLKWVIPGLMKQSMLEGQL